MHYPGGNDESLLPKVLLKAEPVLMRMSSPLQVREKVLSIILKVMQYSSPELLRALLKGIPVSSFIASLLGVRDTGVLAVGVRLSELLMLKLPDVFATMFLKEGVFHSLEQLAKEAPPAAAEKKSSKRSSSRLKVAPQMCTSLIASMGAT